MRKIPSQVPQAMSRLIESRLVRTPPPWYNAVLANPPPVLPARQTTPRSRPGAAGKFDDLPVKRKNPYAANEKGESSSVNTTATHLKQKHLRPPKPRPAPIVYPADRIRLQFFSDFPFEALRPTTLVEGREIIQPNPINGSGWTSLAQRGAYPTVEDTIEFVLNLHENGKSLTAAYAQATDEFVELRAAHEMATLAAAQEARMYGAEFKRDDWTRVFDMETKTLNESSKAEIEVETEARSHRFRKTKMWTREINPDKIPTGEFSAGRAYAGRWSLPAAASSEVEAAGDLISAIGSAPAEPQPTKDELEDLELMNAILGNTAQPSA